MCRMVTRSIPDGKVVYELSIPFRVFKLPSVTSDGMFLVVPSADGMKASHEKGNNDQDSFKSSLWHGDTKTIPDTFNKIKTR